jgi:copper homeostasis protein
MPNHPLLEIAVDSLARATAAERAGAHRLELCADLSVGGLTPGLDLLRQVHSAVRIPIHAMVRPRAGDFFYSFAEFAQMSETIQLLKAEKIPGIVFGALLRDGSVDTQRTRKLVALAAPMQVTFHRAFDETKDLAAALEDVILTGAHRILTSGGAAGALSGATVLRSLVQQAGKRITILPGSGLHPRNIAAVARATGACELHTGLGSVIAYSSEEINAFETAVRACVANLQS